MKLHSGRKADTRDLVVISTRADFDRIERHLHRGDPERLAMRIQTVIERFEADNFEDSFKGVFQQGEIPSDQVDELISFLSDQRAKIQ
jgi:hypothetical protein